MSSSASQNQFIPLNLALLTSSDTRDERTDKSGAYLADALTQAGHDLVEKAICSDNKYAIRKYVSKWVADDTVQAVIITGGTGIFSSDQTPEAVEVLYDKKIDGFGELFRMRSYEEIGTSTIQSRATAGIANNTLIFVLPGSTGACKTGWSIISEQLDASKKQCNFVKVLTRDGK